MTNIIILQGRQTGDAQVRSSQNSSTTARMTLAVERNFKKENQPTADFIPCVAFGKTAELLEKHGAKGREWIVEGHIQTGSYENKEGKKVYATNVVIDRLSFIGTKNQNDAATAPTDNAAMEATPAVTAEAPIPEIDENLPFN